MASLNKLLGITYLVGKNKVQNVENSGPLAKSKQVFVET